MTLYCYRVIVNPTPEEAKAGAVPELSPIKGEVLATSPQDLRETILMKNAETLLPVKDRLEILIRPF